MYFLRFVKQSARLPPNQQFVCQTENQMPFGF